MVLGMSKIYIVGSLRNPDIPKIGNFLRSAYPGIEVFDDWFAAGPEADDKWRLYEQSKGNTYWDALQGYAANNVFDFDRKHLDEATHVILALPAGRSGHLELGYAVGRGKHTAILFPADGVDPDRWDVMALFADYRAVNMLELTGWLDGTI